MSENSTKTTKFPVNRRGDRPLEIPEQCNGDAKISAELIGVGADNWTLVLRIPKSEGTKSHFPIIMPGGDELLERASYFQGENMVLCAEVRRQGTTQAFDHDSRILFELAAWQLNVSAQLLWNDEWADSSVPEVEVAVTHFLPEG